jgi:hypothetical protein
MSMTTSQTEKGSQPQINDEYVASTDYKDGALMEPVVATGGNRSQIGPPRKRRGALDAANAGVLAALDTIAVSLQRDEAPA